MLGVMFLLAMQDTPPSPLRYFDGSWSCEGHFIPSNRPLASDMTFRPSIGEASAKDHQDRAPGRYHAQEVWAPAPGGGYRATIVSNAGMRWFTSPGWEGDRWTWSRRPSAGEPEERFVYVRTGDDRMDVEWWVWRNQALELGDVLHCDKSPDADL